MKSNYLIYGFYGRRGTGKSYYEMKKELNRLKESEEYYKKGFAELYKRIVESIEYIHNNYPVCAGKDLLEILQGEDK